MTSRIDPNEYSDAMRSVNWAKNIFLGIIVLALLVQAGGFVAVRFFKVIDNDSRVLALQPEEKPEAPEDSPKDADDAVKDSKSAPSNSADSVDPKARNRARLWYNALGVTLAGTQKLALVCGVLLVITVMFASALSLMGRSGAVAGYFSAFFWSLLLLAILIPWKRILHTSVTTGALFTLSDLVDWTGKVLPRWGAVTKTSILQNVSYFARFAAFPVVTLLISLSVQLKFSRGLRKSVRPSVEDEA